MSGPKKPIRQRDVAKLMGQVVLVEKTYERDYPESAQRGRSVKTWVSKDVKPRPGWVVGFRYLQAGYSAFVGYEEGYEWRPSGETFPCLLVVYWPSLNPVRVPLDGYTLGALAPYPTPQCWTRGDCIQSAEIMEGWARRKNGTWKAFSEFTNAETQVYNAWQNNLARQLAKAKIVVSEILAAGGEHAEWLMREKHNQQVSEARVILLLGDPRKEKS